jgi:integrase
VTDRKVTHNSVRYVELPKQVKRDPETWSAAQVRAFLTAATHSDEFRRLRESAGIARITLRNSRATANTLMADAGVPDHMRAAWCGHTVAVNVASYTAVRPESFECGAWCAQRGSQPRVTLCDP